MNLFKKKKEITSTEPPTKKRNWLKISVIANIVIFLGIVAALGGFEIIHQSDTNPSFCATCHLMKSHVDTYLTGHTLDSVHAKAGVQCKDCHDYSIAAEIDSGIKYITGNYEQPLRQRKFQDAMCIKCHISLDYVANQTDYLVRNPHMSHWPDLKCSTCHISHGEQVDYCDQCHDNGGQRLTGAPIVPRAANPWAPGNEHPEGAPGEDTSSQSSTGGTP